MTALHTLVNKTVEALQLNGKGKRTQLETTMVYLHLTCNGQEDACQIINSVRM